jgi:putative membrane protein
MRVPASNSQTSEDAMAQNEPDLGAMRTMMAADRTLMAWIRTSLSMLSFGYTIYRILQEVQDVAHVRGPTPQNAGMFLTVTGTAALVMGIAEYLGTLRLLRRSYLFQRMRPALIMSLLMAITGTFLSVGILVRML